MRVILNLINQEKSEVLYRISHFPDGQQNVTLLNPTTPIDKERFLHQLPLHSVEIRTRINNFSDLEKVLCTTKALRYQGVKEIHLYVPYMIGARSDIRFELGSINYLKDIIAPIINSQNYESVICHDPHSVVMEATINNLYQIDNYELLKFTFNDLNLTGSNLSNCLLVSPDGGSLKKIYKLADKIGYTKDILVCSKSRDTQGKLTKTIVPYFVTVDYAEKDIIIIDDICDGGRTFINIAKNIKEKQEASKDWYIKYNKIPGKIYLVVTHGIFSQGIAPLADYIDGIYCTNSYASKLEYDFSTDRGDLSGDFVKQLNIF